MEITEKKEYEVSFLAKDESVATEVLTFLKRSEVEINFEGPLKRISLAYKIKKEPQAVFGFFYTRMSPERVLEIENNLKLNSGVLRSLIITKPFIKPQENILPRIPREVPAKETTYPKATVPLSNEDLEKKIDEILK